MGYSPWGGKESDMIEQLHSLQCGAPGRKNLKGPPFDSGTNLLLIMLVDMQIKISGTMKTF